MKWHILFFKYRLFFRRQGSTLRGKRDFPGPGTHGCPHSDYPRGAWAATFTPAALPRRELPSARPTDEKRKQQHQPPEGEGPTAGKQHNVRRHRSPQAGSSADYVRRWPRSQCELTVGHCC